MHLTQVAQFVVALVMAEYPRTVLEFRDWFADEVACRDYLARLRWPNRQRRAPRLLLGRVHLPLQPPHIRIARPRVPATDTASRQSRPGPCQRNPRRPAAYENQLIDV